jgi:amidohydrolase
MDKKTVQELKTRIKKILPKIIAIRHNLHREPEIGFKEFKTRAKIRQAFKNTSLSVWKPLIGTDFIGELKGRGKRTICLRADIDALPQIEKTGLPYQSKIEGMMHACGHDGHTAILIGTALVLDQLKEYLPVNVRFVFQPFEEGLGGGYALIKKGACKDIEAAYALHAWVGLPQGCIATKAGPLFAAGTHLSIQLLGRSSHGCQPEKSINPIPAGVDIIKKLQKLHDKINKTDGSLVSVCCFKAGENDNIIPDKAVIKGSARYLNMKRADKIEGEIKKIVVSAIKGTGLKSKIVCDRRHIIPVNNTKKGADLIQKLAREHLPRQCFQPVREPTLGMEDFAHFIKGREGAMFWLGQGVNGPSIHNSKFDFSDKSIVNGIFMFCMIALSS